MADERARNQLPVSISSDVRTPAASDVSAFSNGTCHARSLRWLPLWSLALLLCCTLLAAIEIFARRYGHKPDVPDSLELWRYHRAHVVGNNPNLLVAIGTSRIRADISPEVVSELLPDHRLIQLGFNGPSSAVGLLNELSTIPGFCGTVLCDIPPGLFDPHRWDDQPKYYRLPVARTSIANSVIYCAVRGQSAAVNEALSLRACFGGHRVEKDDEWPRAFRVHFDRSLSFDCLPEEVVAQIRDAKLAEFQGMVRGARQYATIKEFRDTLRPLSAVVARIRRNRGQVVFLRLPSSGPRLEVEESAYPAKSYLSALAEVTAAPCIDFRELPHQSEFRCTDDSHLSPGGARAFTRSLLAHISNQLLVSGQID
jgi:hypothetical protein